MCREMEELCNEAKVEEKSQQREQWLRMDFPQRELQEFSKLVLKQFENPKIFFEDL